jgi:glyoxylase-like metal-dependent hydrolase (beta-lactamase superfamily II)
MPLEIKTITFSGVNCYLVRTGGNFILIDTGFPKSRTDIETEIANSGCRPGNLSLIFITHGDPDHIGNAAFLRDKFGAKIAMNRADSGMTEHGDFFGSRNVNGFINAIAKMLAPFVLKKSDRFTADIFAEDGWDFAGYGLEATGISTPGHSGGSMSVLTPGGDLFCGDLLVNRKKPGVFRVFHTDLKAANATIENLKTLNVKTVYPGHGKTFAWEDFMKNPSE